MPAIIEALGLDSALGWLGFGGGVYAAGAGVSSAATGVGQGAQQTSASLVPLLLIGGGIFLALALVKK